MVSGCSVIFFTRGLILKEEQEKAASWNLDDSRELYGIDHWGSRYFGVSPDGDVTVRLRKGASWSDVSMHSMALGAQERGLCMPVLFRFRDILDSRIIRFKRELCSSN